MTLALVVVLNCVIFDISINIEQLPYQNTANSTESVRTTTEPKLKGLK